MVSRLIAGISRYKSIGIDLFFMDLFVDCIYRLSYGIRLLIRGINLWINCMKQLFNGSIATGYLWRDCFCLAGKPDCLSTIVSALSFSSLRFGEMSLLIGQPMRKMRSKSSPTLDIPTCAD